MICFLLVKMSVVTLFHNILLITFLKEKEEENSTGEQIILFLWKYIKKEEHNLTQRAVFEYVPKSIPLRGTVIIIYRRKHLTGTMPSTRNQEIRTK